MDKRTQGDAAQSKMIKEPKDWATGDEPMTGVQKSYLKTLSEEVGEAVDESLTKAEASELISLGWGGAWPDAIRGSDAFGARIRYCGGNAGEFSKINKNMTNNSCSENYSKPDFSIPIFYVLK